jgi:hypothetical protein
MKQPSINHHGGQFGAEQGESQGRVCPFTLPLTFTLWSVESPPVVNAGSREKVE